MLSSTTTSSLLPKPDTQLAEEYEELLRTALSEAMETIGASAGQLALVDLENGELVFHQTMGEGWTPELARRRIRIVNEEGRGIIARVAATGRPYRTGDTTRDPYYLALFTSISLSYRMISGHPLPQSVQSVTSVMHQFGLGNVYHVFPNMQTERMELQIEGSQDGKHWQPYVFRYKPGPLNRKPAFIVPHQPRLDWMIWFVPSKNPQVSTWMEPFMLGLWHNQTAITELLEDNPFAHKAPRYLRISAYRYHFTSRSEYQQSGNWWQRQYLGEFSRVAPRIP